MFYGVQLLRLSLVGDRPTRVASEWGLLDRVKYIYFNSLAPRRYGSNFENVIAKLSLKIDIMSISQEITLMWPI